MSGTVGLGGVGKASDNNVVNEVQCGEEGRKAECGIFFF